MISHYRDQQRLCREDWEACQEIANATRLALTAAGWKVWLCMDHTLVGVAHPERGTFHLTVDLNRNVIES